MNWWTWLAVAVAVLVVVCWPISAHNTLVSMQAIVVESWRDVEVELTRRWELIPSLVEVADRYAEHEASVLTRVVAQRHSARVDSEPSTAREDSRDDVIADETRANTDLADALTGLRAVAESHPDLRSSRQYALLMSALQDTDDRIAAARRLYNGNVSRFNAKLRSFPASFFAGRKGLSPAESFTLASPDHAGVPPLRARRD